MRWRVVVDVGLCLFITESVCNLCMYGRECLYMTESVCMCQKGPEPVAPSEQQRRQKLLFFGSNVFLGSALSVPRFLGTVSQQQPAAVRKTSSEHANFTNTSPPANLELSNSSTPLHCSLSTYTGSSLVRVSILATNEHGRARGQAMATSSTRRRQERD